MVVFAQMGGWAVSRNVTYDIDLVNLGKVPPQALELEEAVLGTCMNDKEAILDAMDVIKSPEVFYKEAHQKIFAAFIALYTSGNPIDILSVTQQLKKDGCLEEVGGPLYITQLSGKAVIASHTSYHCKIILQKWMQREIIRITTESQGQAYDDSNDVADIASDMVRGVSDVLNVVVGDTTRHASEVTQENTAIIEKIMTGEHTLQGISTGIKELDDQCNGLQKSDLVIIAARPSIGKTALAVTMAYNISVINDFVSVIFSLEMSSHQLDMRLKILGSEVESSKVYRGHINTIEMQRIREVSDNIAASSLYIDDTPGLTLMDIRTRLQRIFMQRKVDVVFIDYIQLMKSNSRRGRSREQEVSEISQGLKNLAREFNIPVVAMAQLNRSVEMMSEQRPRLSTLRESGSLEADSDQVWLIYRAYKSGIKQYEDGTPTYDKAEIIVAKHRNGATGDVKVGFYEKIMKFMSLSKLGDTQLKITHSDLYGEISERETNPF